MDKLTYGERERLLDLLQENLSGVRRGDISGYGQSKDDEIADIKELMAKVQGSGSDKLEG